MVAVVDEHPHGPVDALQVLRAVEVLVVLVPGHGVLWPGPRAGDDESVAQPLLVELNGHLGQPGPAAHFGHIIEDGHHALLDLLLLLAGHQAAPNQQLGVVVAGLGPELPGHSPRTTRHHIGQYLAVAGREVRALQVAQTDTPLLPAHPAAVAGGPLPEGGEDAEAPVVLVFQGLLALVLEGSHHPLTALDVHVVGVKVVPLAGAAEIQARVFRLRPKDQEAEHADAEADQYVAAHAHLGCLGQHPPIEVRQHFGVAAAQVLLIVPDDSGHLLRLAGAGELEAHVGQVGRVVKHQESRAGGPLKDVLFLHYFKSLEAPPRPQEHSGVGQAHACAREGSEGAGQTRGTKGLWGF